MSTQTIPTTLQVHGTQSHFEIISPTKRTSKALCGFGIAEIIFSVLLFSSCLWSSSVDSGIVAAYFGFVSAIFHTALGALAITAGRDLERYRGRLISCLIMGVVGSCIFVVATIIADSVQWSDYKYRCSLCQYRRKNKHFDNDEYSLLFNDVYRCVRICMFPSGPLFLPILYFSITEAIVGIILSGLSCYNLRICNQQIPTNINARNNYNAYHQPNVPVLPLQPQLYSQQHHVNYPPPNYSESATTNP